VVERCGERRRDGVPCDGIVMKGWRFCPHHVLSVSARFARELHGVEGSVEVRVPRLGRRLDELEREELLGLGLFLAQTVAEVTV
jgi:hypothetical protein